MRHRLRATGLKFAVPSQTTYNDLPAGTAFISLEFAASTVTITGNPLAVIDSVTVDSGADGSIIEAPLTICGTDYTVAAGTTAIDYDITGADTLRKLGGGTLKLDYANDFTGDTEIVAGTLLLNNSLALQNSTLDMTAGDTGVLDFGTLTAATFGGLSGSPACACKRLLSPRGVVRWQQQRKHNILRRPERHGRQSCQDRQRNADHWQ